MSERDMPAGGGSSPYDEPTGELPVDNRSARRRPVPHADRDNFYARHARSDNDDVGLDTDALAARPGGQQQAAAQPPPHRTHGAADEAGEVAGVAGGAAVVGGAAAGGAAAAHHAQSRSAEPAEAPDTTATEQMSASAPTQAYPAEPSGTYPAGPETAAATAPVAADDAATPADDSDSAASDELTDARRKARRGTLDIGLLLLRCAVGVIMAAHGAQHLFGWFHGPGLSGFQDFLSNSSNHNIAFNPDAAKPLAIVGAVSESLGGVMLILGVFTPVAASAVLGVMLVAGAYKATLAGGVWFFATDGHGHGLEFEGLLAVCAAAIILTGPGRISIDAPRGWARRPAWGSLVLLVIGIAAAVVVWLVFNGTNPIHSPGNPATT